MGVKTKRGSAAKIKIDNFDDLFGGTVGREDAAGQILDVPLAELHTFKDHPFRVEDDNKMQETVESIKRYGVLVPGIVRPHPDGGYEVIAGHRRWRACELAGIREMPVIIRELDDDEATVIMVDTNIQREDLLPSEKAKAYKMKYAAMKHQGKKSGRHTADEVGEAAGESGRTVQRYIRLAELEPGLLDHVDAGRIPMVVGELLSYLHGDEQAWVARIIADSGSFPSKVQAEQLRALSETGELTASQVCMILAKKEKGKAGASIPIKKIRGYFPAGYTRDQMEEVIYRLLEGWKRDRGGAADEGDQL